MEIKIILSGLQNAGKSSLILSLEKMYDYEKALHELKPTIRIDYFHRTFMGLNVNIFDMGGQKKFRETYLKKPIYFESLDALIYLIDIQDEEKFKESIEYLGKVLDVINEDNPNKKFPIHICFSKSDYEIVEKFPSEYQDRQNMLRELIEKSYPMINFKYFQTSVYHIFTVSHIFSNCLYPFQEKGKLITNSLQTLLDQLNLDFCVVFERNGLALGEVFKKNLTHNTKFKIISLLSEQLDYYARLEDNDIKINGTKSFIGDYLHLCYQFASKNNLHGNNINLELDIKKNSKNRFKNYYLAILKKGTYESKFEDSFIKTIENIQNILS
ncbi:MAG: ADP-ribosylation factor-like protein [Promethearchaeota archaeon]